MMQSWRSVFMDGARIAVQCLILHHTDLGGRVPGGNAADSSEIFQEGLRIPPSKIYEGGQPNTTLLRILEHNTRIPQRMMGDIHAQVAALNTAEKELKKLALATQVTTLKRYMAELIDYTERLTRAKIAALPDGTAEFTDWNDDDGAGSGPVKFHVKLTKKGDEFIVDFTGTAPQGGGALHMNYAFTASCTYAALRCVIDPDIPNNAGFYKPITVIAPERTFVNVHYPAALGARGQGGFRVRSSVLGALATLLPDRGAACAGGSEFAIVFAGYEGKEPEFSHIGALGANIGVTDPGTIVMLTDVIDRLGLEVNEATGALVIPVGIKPTGFFLQVEIPGHGLHHFLLFVKGKIHGSPPLNH